MQCHQNVLLDNGPHPNRLNQPFLHITATSHPCTFIVQNPAKPDNRQITGILLVNFFFLLFRNYTTSSLLGKHSNFQHISAIYKFDPITHPNNWVQVPLSSGVSSPGKHELGWIPFTLFENGMRSKNHQETNQTKKTENHQQEWLKQIFTNKKQKTKHASPKKRTSLFLTGSRVSPPF